MPTQFESQLSDVATHARRLASKISRLAHLKLAHAIDRPAYVAYSLTAAFNAFIALGGNPDAPEEFPWDERAEALRLAAAQQLRRRIRSEVEQDNDEVLRHRVRPEAAHIDEYRWDAWRAPIGGAFPGEDELDSLPTFVDVRAPQDLALHESLLQGLGEELAALLPPRDVELLCRHYFEGIPQRQLAEELQAELGNTPKQAENAVNVRITRARTRLRALLAPCWRAYLVEGAA